MDLNGITRIERPTRRADLSAFGPADAWLAGGTWLFSEPQPNTSRLIDLDALGWADLTVNEAGLQIGATSRIARLAAFAPPAAWRAGPLFHQCCEALLGSFKIWNMATVGGNLCLALPAGPMTALCTALDGLCTIWHGERERVLPAAEFVLGPQQNALQPGEVLRAIDLPLAALRRRTAFRQISLSTYGRSAALLIGTRDLASGAFALTVTGSTRRPVQLRFPALPIPDALAEELEQAIPPALYHDDVHGDPTWRAAMTRRFAQEIRQELAP
jgi:CO/xanthine dehydrogenase FAD-binding subunit